MRSRTLAPLLVIAGFMSGCQMFEPIEQPTDAGVLNHDLETPQTSITAKSAQENPPGQKLASIQTIDQLASGTLISPPDRATPPVDAVYHPPESDNLWDITRSHLVLHNEAQHDAVQIQIDWYRKYPGHMRRITENASRYYYYILNEVLERGMPAEIALLPAVESHFDADAYSKGHAAGIWQFIPSTAKYFGIKRTRWYDGRRDLIDSTRVALNYLEKLNKRFDGDWLLTMAAYNAGGGTVSKAIRKNKNQGKPTDYWSLPLPKETRLYVPRILAIASFVSDPDEHNMELPAIQNEPYFDIVKTKGAVNLKQAAKLSGTRLAELQLLNPGFSELNTDPAGPHRLLVPVNKANQMIAALNGTSTGQITEWASYTIQSGDSLSTIADKFGSSVADIKSANELNSNLLIAGKSLIIPQLINDTQTSSATQKIASASSTTPRFNDNSISQYKIKSGDTLWSIARKYGVEPSTIAQWNNMGTRDTLVAGRSLRIGSLPSSIARDEAEALRKIGYQVQNGDSLSVIASRYNVSIDDILAWNKISGTSIKAGQELTLFVD